MATTLKLKKPATPGARRDAQRAPVRGSGPKKPRPTLAQAQAERAQRGEQTLAQRGEQTLAQRGEQTLARRGEHAPAQRGEQAPAPRAKPHRAPRDARRPARDEPAAHGRREPAAAHEAPAPHAPGSLRLSKRMSELGIASRREADEWIARGWVRVDGRVVAELGARVLPQQRITIDPRAGAQQAQRATVLLNKPVGYVSGQAEDGYEPALVLVTPQRQWQGDDSGLRLQREHLRSLVPAGRLDIDSVGLLVLTQDGRIARQLIGETSAVEKEYLVRVEPLAGAPLDDAGLALLRHGIALDGEPLRPAQVDRLADGLLRFVLTQGRKRQIRRMCEAVGLKVTSLKRVRIGRVVLGDLPPGQWRFLRPGESFV
jgi:23S rRNA pseudouridine2604 synthase